MHAASHTDRRSATLGGLAAIVLWSGTVALARALSERVGPIKAAALVYSIGAVAAALPALIHRRRPTNPPPAPRRYRYLVGCGLLFALYTLLLFVAVGEARDRTEVLEVGLLNYLWPTLTILLSLPLLGQRAGPGLIPGTAVALSGLFLVLSPPGPLSLGPLLEHAWRHPAAHGTAIAAAVCWALYSNLARRWGGPSAAGGVPWFLGFTALALLSGQFLTPAAGPWDLRGLTEAVVLGLVTAGAYSLWDRALRRGNVAVVATASYLTPLLSTLLSCVYLGVTPTPRLLLGCGMLIAGSLFSWRSLRVGSG